MRASRDPYVTTALFGIALLLAGSGTYLIAVLLADPARAPLELIFWIPGLGITVALLLRARVGLALGIVGGAPASLLLVSELEPALMPFDSFFDFVPVLLALPGALIILGASIAGSIHHFRGGVGGTSPTLLRLGAAWLAVVVVLAAASAALTLANADTVGEAEAEGAIVLVAEGVAWDTELIEVDRGAVVRLLVKNKDPFVHTFTIDDLGVDEVIGPWREQIIEIEPEGGRIYGFICRIEDHKDDMSGAITVR